MFVKRISQSVTDFLEVRANFDSKFKTKNKTAHLQLVPSESCKIQVWNVLFEGIGAMLPV